MTTSQGKLLMAQFFFKLKEALGNFISFYYQLSINKLEYHSYYKNFFGNHDMIDTHAQPFWFMLGDIMTRSDYTKNSFTIDGQLQGFFSKDCGLSMEEFLLNHFTPNTIPR